MSRDYFTRTTGNAARVDGSIISDIQASLNAITAFAIRVDGSVVDTIDGPFKDDVRQRKMCIAQGNGIVHRAGYNLAEWGLADGFTPQST
jgi:hypothetical protein